MPRSIPAASTALNESVCVPSRAVCYNFRYFLPHAPQWGSEAFCRRRLEELLVFCREARVDAVQFFVNTLPGTYYMPARSATEQKHWAAWMAQEVAPAVRAIDVSYQLNLQMLLGAGSGGLDMRDQYGWGFLINQHGEETLGCACPIDPDFRRIMGEMLRLWASTRPDVLWIDDDFRLHNHGLDDGKLDFYCFCPRHLDRLAERVGRRYERAELVTELLRPGEPSPMRGHWLDVLNQTMAETAAWIRQQVRSISPQTRLAQMVSMPDVHSAEGRDWLAFLTALCGEDRPIIRPCSAVYTGTVVPANQDAASYLLMNQTMTVVEQALGLGRAEYGPELENTRYTTWCKSVRHSAYLLVLGQLLGCPQVTLAIHDLDGSPLDEEPTNRELLRENKPRLQALADLDLRSWSPAGLALISDPDAARKVQLPAGAAMQDLGLGRPWEEALAQMGVPAFYASPRQIVEGQAVVTLTGFSAWCPSDAELAQILSGGVLLDGGAAWVIQQRGFGHHLGVRVVERGRHGLHAEVFESGVVPDVEEVRVPNRCRAWYVMQPAGATVVSRLIDPLNRRHVGSTIFENELGGRVAVYAVIGDSRNTPFTGCVFTSHAHLRWLHGVLRWLSRETFVALPVIPHHGLTVVRRRNDRTLLTFANLGTDAVENLKVRLPASLNHLERLDGSGQWCSVELGRDDDSSTMTLPCRLETFEWLIALLS